VGHIGVVFQSPYASELRKQTLHRTAAILAKQVTTDPLAASLGQGTTAAEAMMATVYQGLRLSRNRTPVFMEDVSAVLSGHTIDLGEYLGKREPDKPTEGSYYVGYEGSLGLKSRFRDPDPTNEQVHHFWFYVQLAYETEGVVALAANIFHEGYWKQSGRSLADYRLGRAGQRLGSLARLSYFWPTDIAEWLTMRVVQ
jgi:hypothetical protein